MQTKTIPAVLSIAGSDSSGGAGIQADIKTITAHRLFAETAVTSLTAQNTTGVRAVQDATPAFVAAQIDAVFEDIPPAAVKIGMVSQVGIIEAIAERLEHWEAPNIVVDPVMVATSGARLISDDAMDALVNRLFPLATVITPNIEEARALGDGREVATAHDQERLAADLAQRFGCAVLLKGGHNVNDANDVLAVPNANRKATHTPRGSATSGSRPRTPTARAARSPRPSPASSQPGTNSWTPYRSPRTTSREPSRPGSTSGTAPARSTTCGATRAPGRRPAEPASALAQTAAPNAPANMPRRRRRAQGARGAHATPIVNIHLR